MSEGRCMKCKKQVEILEGKEVVTKNNLLMIKGVCPECQTKVCRIVGKAKKTEEAEETGEAENEASPSP